LRPPVFWRIGGAAIRYAFNREEQYRCRHSFLSS
jgi:hypothetical protein